MAKNQANEESSILMKTARWILYILIGLFVGFVLWNGIDKTTEYNFPFFGLRMSVISSESMASVHPDNEDFLSGHDGRLSKNDLIFTLAVPSIEDLEVYDVITFLDEDNGLTCHRIVRIDYEDGQIWTRGDANNVLDGVVTIDEVKGRVIGTIPGIGVITLYLNSPYGLLGVSLAFAILFTALIIMSEMDKKDPPRSLEETIDDVESMSYADWQPGGNKR